MTAPEQPRVGEVLGERFELRARLGEGGMASVFLAYDRALERELALKLLAPRYVGRPERERRLTNEAHYLRRLAEHPNVVRFIDAGRIADRHRWPWLATEHLVGRPLGLLLALTELEAPAVIAIATAVARALQAAHRAKVVHRDVTPSNVFCLASFDLASPTVAAIKLFDFGHAAALDRPDSPARPRLTGVLEVPGTLGFMAPEQAANFPATPAMDVFGLGALLWQTITRQRPYESFTDRGRFIAAQREDLQAPRMRAWAWGIPEGLAALVHDCMRREPETRPTLAEVLARLDELSHERPASPAAAPSDNEGEPRARWPWWIAGLVTMAGVAGSASAVRCSGHAPIETPGMEAANNHADPREGVSEVAAPTATVTRNSATNDDAPDRPPSVDHEDSPRPNERAPKTNRTPRLRPDSPSCTAPRAAVEAAYDAWRWREILQRTKRANHRSCWTSGERTSLRVKAHLELGEWRSCVDEGARSTDPEVVEAVRGCRLFIED